MSNKKVPMCPIDAGHLPLPSPSLPSAAITVIVVVVGRCDGGYEFFEKEIILSAWVTAIFFID